ncbi:MAG: hypothetical protein NTU49_00435, partial [Gammaproteobacteria bacterium]|nr:hypothetical protein [Gammaproteobacteria bacterium]
MEVLAILLLTSGLIGFLFYYENRLSKRTVENKTDNHFKPLLDELKNIDQMQFQIVSREIIYSKTLSVFCKTIGYLLSIAAIAFFMDFITIKDFTIHNPGNIFLYLGFYLFVSFIFFIFPLLSCTW